MTESRISALETGKGKPRPGEIEKLEAFYATRTTSGTSGGERNRRVKLSRQSPPPPVDQKVRQFLDALADAVADQLLAELRAGAKFAVEASPSSTARTRTRRR